MQLLPKPTLLTGGGTRGQNGPPHPRLLTGKFLLTYREKRGKAKKGKCNKRKKENCKREGENRWKIENGSRKSYKISRRPFFFFFIFLFFYFLKFVLGLPKWKFSSTSKKHFTPGRKIRNLTV